ncbi:hypothetical protein SKUN_001053 [Spiroplasma kunkelii CR2-3x]|uniref:Uncharacterized protein n=1 Tax=Spiroplasma kunkelii CR2-3x TaxID=273035 RepID=A0A0K2JH67_SPIKU|nr:hypothetical protein [Spiroplasma kunkelii]ALA97939.1 hypothetical protein SKUN_001053 [Spiroplasma kunkelii CR2-3x]
MKKTYLSIKDNAHDFSFTNWIWTRQNYYNYKKYFKAVYRWNLKTKEPNLVIDNYGSIKVNEG